MKKKKSAQKMRRIVNLAKTRVKYHFLAILTRNWPASFIVHQIHRMIIWSLLVTNQLTILGGALTQVLTIFHQKYRTKAPTTFLSNSSINLPHYKKQRSNYCLTKLRLQPQFRNWLRRTFVRIRKAMWCNSIPHQKR